MIRRSFQSSSSTAAVFAAIAVVSASACVKAAVKRDDMTASPASSSAYPERAVRRNIPMTPIIAKAHAAGTRDSTGRPGRNYWQLRTDYTIDATLNPQTSMLNGHETIVLHNHSPDDLNSIGMRFDQNIFRAHSYLASSWMPSEVTDGMVVTKLVVNGVTADLSAPQGRGGAPGRPGAPGRAGGGARPLGLQRATMTNPSISLPSPIPAHGTATIEIDWNFKVAGGPNGAGHRMTSRWADSLYQLTQWYPRVAVYDDLRGWDPEMYLGPSEFYNNFGRFDVTIDVPAGYVVGATGKLQNPEEVLTAASRERLTHVTQSDNTLLIVGPDEVGPGSATAMGTPGPDGVNHLRWHFVADTVNDFAWGTAKKYVWAATRATIPGRGAIPLNMYYLPGHYNLYNRADTVGRHALEFYSKLWMPYEFPQMSMIDGPSAGMEYPMVVMSNQGAGDHEIGHSWWPMMVSNNETWYGWMDEGFNQYMNIFSDADARGRTGSVDNRGRSFGSRVGNENDAPMMWDANFGGPQYGYQVYQKTPPMLSMLGGIVGDSAVLRAQSEYAKTWRFKHPSPWDYMFFMNNALHQDLGWFWYYWLFTNEGVLGSIQNVTTNGTKTAVTVRQDGEMPSPVVLLVEFAPTGPAIKPMPNSTMQNATSAIVTYPVDVWFAGSRTFVANLDFGGRTITKITFDPFGRFPDRDVADNVWPRGAPASRR
jgi:hypothetical protein